MKHSPGAVEPAIARRHRCRDDDQVDYVCGTGDADPVKHEDERAHPWLDLSPGDQRHDHDQCANIEDQDAVDDAVGGRGQDDLGIFGLTSGHADQLHSLKPEHHHLEREQHTEYAER